MISAPRALVLSGDGINCERETDAAAREAGFRSAIIHVNDLLASQGKELNDTKLLVIPGGFSFGDELGSGKILALKLKHLLKGALDRYIDAGGAVFGICNGFQVLTRLGVFGEGVALTQNKTRSFHNKWVGLKLTGKSLFTDRLRQRGVTRLELPIRHGEGRLLFTNPRAAQTAWDQGACVLQYESDVNGAWNEVAALSARGGRVMGMMPHPEAFWTEELHPWGNQAGVPLGVELFKSAYEGIHENN